MSNVQLFNQDCMEAMRGIPDKAFSLAIVDPPYGIFGTGGGKTATMAWTKGGTGGTWASKYGKKAKQWDIAPTAEYFSELKRVSENQIIWGANHFPYSSVNYVVWRKLTISESFSMGMCEYASVSCKGNPKVFDYMPQDPQRFHPTQKPVALYQWLLKNYAKPGDKILDTHLGSGSSAIAADIMGFDFTGYEIDESYFLAAKERFERHKQQTTMFGGDIYHAKNDQLQCGMADKDIEGCQNDLQF